MNENLLDSANLYVLGLLTAPEREAFERALTAHPEIQKEVQSLQEATLLLARSAPQVAAPAELRGQLLAAFTAQPPAVEPQIRSLPGTGSPGGSSLAPPQSPLRLLHFIPWAAAAAMAVLFQQNREVAATAEKQAALAQAEAGTIKEREKHLLEAVTVSEAAKAKSEATLAEMRQTLSQAESALAALDTEKSTLLAELTSLREDSELDKTRIAVLGSLIKNQPAAVAVSLWRQERQDGLLIVENLPTLPAGRDYQLWVIDPNLKTPVSAGVFKVDAAGKVRIEFKPDRAVQSAYKFAVTVEQEGGAKVPTLDQMVVIGG